MILRKTRALRAKLGITTNGVEIVYAPLRDGLAGFYHHGTRTIAINSNTSPACPRVTL